MNLYFIAKQVSDTNLDCFVCALNPEQARDLWMNEEWVKQYEEVERVPDWIFLVPATPHLDQMLRGPHCLAWHSDIKELTGN